MSSPPGAALAPPAGGIEGIRRRRPPGRKWPPCRAGFAAPLADGRVRGSLLGARISRRATSRCVSFRMARRAAVFLDRQRIAAGRFKLLERKPVPVKSGGRPCRRHRHAHFRHGAAHNLDSFSTGEYCACTRAVTAESRGGRTMRVFPRGCAPCPVGPAPQRPSPPPSVPWFGELARVLMGLPSSATMRSPI